MLWKGRLTEQGTRHETQKNLILDCFRTGKKEKHAYEIIKSWYAEGKTNGLSNEWGTDQVGTLKRLKAHVRSFYAWLKGK